VNLWTGETANFSEPAMINFTSDSSFLSPSVAEAMLHELENPPDELTSLTKVISGLISTSSEHKNCSTGITVTRDSDDEVIEHDVHTQKISHKMQKQKSRYNHPSDARTRVSKLKELNGSSRQMVSMFIPPDAPKLSFTSDVIGMCHDYL